MRKQYFDLSKEEYNNLKCRDIVRCKTHKRVKGIAVELFDGGHYEDEGNTLCGCKPNNYQWKKPKNKEHSSKKVKSR